MKFTSLRANWRYWVIGILVSTIGVVLARLVAPSYTDKTRAALSGVGRLVAASGLILIAVGVSRRVAVEEQTNP